MKLTQLKLFAIKLALYSGGLLYIASDLFLWQGPLWSMLHHDKAKIQEEQRATALSVYGVKMTNEQLKRCEAEAAALSDSATAENAKSALIHNTLLRIRTQYNDSRVPDYTETAQKEAERLASRAPSTQHFDQLLQSQGYTRESYTHKLTAIMRQQHYLDKLIEKKCQITEADINAAMANVGDVLYVPSRRDISHIFLSSVQGNADEVKTRAESLLVQLNNVASPAEQATLFAELASKYSEDAQSQARGGSLGKIVTYPEPVLSELNLFDEASTPTGIPVLKQSKWGWHILLAGPIEKGHYATTEECRESVRTAIISYLRQQALRDWIESNMAEAKKKNRIITNGK